MKYGNFSTKRRKGLGVIDKYYYYLNSVQSAEADAEFIRDTYRKIKKKSPRILREDFCGTFSLCAEWVKLNRENEAYGLDLDPEPIMYGMLKLFPKLELDQQGRLHIYRRNVLEDGLPKADVICALNFSYFILKEREVLKNYFARSFKHLKKDGILMLDCFGGSECQAPISENQRFDGFTYYWEQKSFDPITYNAEFQIHYRIRGKKYEGVFTYDWRMWTIPEIRELLLEAGFKKVSVYWEGTNRKGGGNGIFKKVNVGESCQAWVCYIIGEK